MSCNNRCNQGRECTCATCYKTWGTEVIAILLALWFVGFLLVAVI